MNSENNNFILSADSSSNSSDSVNIKELVVDSGELKKNGESSSLPTETHILISDTDGLNKLSDLVNNDADPFGFLGYTIVLTADLTLSTPIGKDSLHKFNGTFDGQGNTISNSVSITSDSDNAYAGLFGVLGKGSIVKNLGTNSSFSANSKSGDAYSGGIAGYNEGIITNCYKTGALSASGKSGGIAGYNEGIITNCHNIGVVNAAVSVGLGTNTYSGGIAGDNKGTITNCYNTGVMTAMGVTNYSSYSGGITANNSGNGTIANCYNTGNVTADSNSRAYSGGIAGRNYRGTIKNCYNTGNVTATSIEYAYSGGIVGYDEGGADPPKYYVSITNCYNTGAVTAESTTDLRDVCSGGIVGASDSYGVITNCYNTGAVTANAPHHNLFLNNYICAGGIAGRNSETIINCYNAGNVTAISTNKNAEYLYGDACSGGIAGGNDSKATITNCYNIGNVTAISTDGDAYSESTVEDAGSGGIAGDNDGKIENTFYLESSATKSIGNEGGTSETTPLISNEMKGLKLLRDKNNLNKGQDSTKPWSPDIFGVNKGYPILADVPLSIILGSSVPHSSVYLTINDEEYQSTNYLKPKVVIADPNNKLSVNLINLSTDLKVNAENASYEWKKLGVNSFENMPDNSSPYIPILSHENNGTYQAVVTFNVKESEKDSGVNYNYTSLSRTADIKYSVTYDANNGKGLMIDENSPYSSGDEVTILDNTFIAPNGRTFTGWSEKPNPTDGDKVYQAGESITITDQNITLYAVWGDIKYFDVTYHENNGTESTTDKYTYSSEDKVTILNNMFTPPNGKVFAGWSTQSDAITADSNYAPGESIIITADINLYAVWDNIKYSITYNANNGTGSTIESSYSSGDKVTILNNPFIAPDGKEFAGWSAESSAINIDPRYDPSNIIDIVENINLYAVWKDIKYSVYYYYLNDNNKVTIDSNKSPGDTVNVKDIPVKSGYIFNHWLMYEYGDTKPTTIQANDTFQMPLQT